MKSTFFIGIDMANLDFTVAVFKNSLKSEPLIFEKISNTNRGFQQLLDLLEKYDISAKKAVFCMEHCGVYGDKFCHFLFEANLSLAVEDPIKIRRAFRQVHPKTDVMDAIRIAQYAYRFNDELTLWSPKSPLVLEVQTLLSFREQIVKQTTALKNFTKGQKKKKHGSNEMLEQSKFLLDQLTKVKKSTESKIQEVLKTTPATRQKIQLLCSIPGVSTLLASHIMIHTNEFTIPLIPRKFSSYLGMSPHKYESGTSVYKKPRSRQYGPSLMRKLLHLAALSIRTHREEFRGYFRRKEAQGKPKMLILNNIKNKIIKLMAAILRENKPYTEFHQPISPLFMKEALTKS